MQSPANAKSQRRAERLFHCSLPAPVAAQNFLDSAAHGTFAAALEADIICAGPHLRRGIRRAGHKATQRHGRQIVQVVTAVGGLLPGIAVFRHKRLQKYGFLPDILVYIGNFQIGGAAADGLALPSGADATMAIVDYVSGNEETFVALMNQKAKALGMNHTHFTNAVGLHDENHYSTALDIAILMKAAMENPTCRQILGSVEYRTTSTQQHPNGMILLSTMYKRMYGNEVKNMTIIGGKTGFTDQAMQCLASYATAVDGNEYVVVTAYAPTEMNPVFDSFAMYGLVNGGYEMPTHLEKTTYPPTEATTTDSSDDSDSTETASDAETELDSSSEDLYGNGDTEATDPEESSSELYE